MRSAPELHPRFNRRRMEGELPRFVLIVAAYESALPGCRPMVRESDWRRIEPRHFPKRRSAEAIAAWRRSESIPGPRLDTISVACPFLLAAVLMAAFFGPLFFEVFLRADFFRAAFLCVDFFIAPYPPLASARLPAWIPSQVRCAERASSSETFRTARRPRRRPPEASAGRKGRQPCRVGEMGPDPRDRSRRTRARPVLAGRGSRQHSWRRRAVRAAADGQDSGYRAAFLRDAFLPRVFLVAAFLRDAFLVAFFLRLAMT